MLKGLEGVRTHEHREWLPIVENDQDMARLSVVVRGVLEDHPEAHGFLLRRHGLYTWGNDLPQAVRHVEILEFLLEVVGTRLTGGRIMAVVKIPADNITLTETQDVATFLAVRGIEYERWTPSRERSADAPADAVLDAYSHQIEDAEGSAAATSRPTSSTSSPTRPTSTPCSRSSTGNTGTTRTKCGSSSRAAACFTSTPATACSRWKSGGAISSACRAARTTGSTSAPSGASARFGCSRILRAGRRTIPRAASTAGSSRSASVLRTSVRWCNRTREEWLNVSASPPSTSPSCCSTSRARPRRSRSCTTCCFPTRARASGRSSSHMRSDDDVRKIRRRPSRLSSDRPTPNDERREATVVGYVHALMDRDRKSGAAESASGSHLGAGLRDRRAEG